MINRTTCKYLDSLEQKSIEYKQCVVILHNGKTEEIQYIKSRYNNKETNFYDNIDSTLHIIPRIKTIIDYHRHNFLDFSLYVLCGKKTKKLTEYLAEYLIHRHKRIILPIVTQKTN